MTVNHNKQARTQAHPPYINLYNMQEQGDYMTKNHHSSVNPRMKDWSKAERDVYILHGKEPEQKRTIR
jgi:hypothetical protein